MLVLTVATPAVSVAGEPMIVAPSLNVTVPVGVPEPGETAATVAVNVTDAPDALGLALEVRVVVVLDWLTTRLPEFWLNLFVLSPAKLATIRARACPRYHSAARRSGSRRRCCR